MNFQIAPGRGKEPVTVMNLGLWIAFILGSKCYKKQHVAHVGSCSNMLPRFSVEFWPFEVSGHACGIGFRRGWVNNNNT